MKALKTKALKYCVSSSDMSLTLVRPTISRWLIGWCICMGSPALLAIEISRDFNISPFLSQSAVYTSNNNFHGDSDDNVSLDSNEIGAVFNYKATDDLSLSAQIMARNAGNMDNGSLRADYAFAQYRLLNTVDYSLAIKAGKLRLPYGLYNDTRDVAATNPSFILPQSAYIDRARNTFYAANGATLHGENFWGANSITWDIGYVKIEADDNEMDDLAGLPTANGAKGTFNPLARFVVDFDNDTYKVGFSYRDSEFEFTPEMADLQISTGSLKSTAKMLSLQYNAEKWTLTGEWGRTTTSVNFTAEQAFINPPGIWVPVNMPIAANFPTESYYLQMEYRITPTVSLLLARDESYANRNDREGKEFAATLNGYITMLPALSPLARPSYSQYALDNVLGLTWNISPQMLTRIEWHNIEGTFWLSSADNPDAFATEKFWDMVAIQFAYRF